MCGGTAPTVSKHERAPRALRPPARPCRRPVAETHPAPSQTHYHTLPTQILVDVVADSNRTACPVNSKAHVDCKFSNVAIDTTGLANGTHKVFIRTDSFVDPNFSLFANQPKLNGGTFSSVTLFAFKACNPPGSCANDTTTPVDEGPAPDAVPPLNPPPECEDHLERRADDTLEVIQKRLQVRQRGPPPPLSSSLPALPRCGSGPDMACPSTKHRPVPPPQMQDSE